MKMKEPFKRMNRKCWILFWFGFLCVCFSSSELVVQIQNDRK